MNNDYQFKSEYEREIYEKFKDRSFIDEAMSLKQRLWFLDTLLLRIVEKRDSPPLVLDTDDVFALCDILRNAGKFVEDVASASLLESHWIDDINKQTERG